MSIEKDLTRIADALENIADTMSSEKITISGNEGETIMEAVAKAVNVPVATIIEPPPAPFSDDGLDETPVSNSVELDSDGFPHDVRIHSTSKKKLQKSGQWKKQRGVDAELVKTVELELRSVMSIKPTPPVVAEPTPPVVAEPTPPVVAEPTPPVVANLTTFPELMVKITGGLTSGIFEHSHVNKVINNNGIASLPLLAARPDLIPTIEAELFE